MYGYKTILLIIILEIIFVSVLIIMQKEFWQIAMLSLITDIILFGMFIIDSKEIRIYSFSMLFNEKYRFKIDEIKEFKIEGEMGLTPGRLDFKIILKDDTMASGFMVMYSFERKKFKRKLEQTGIFVNTTV